MRKYRYFIFLILIMHILIVSCSTIDVFNQKAYEQSVNLKVEALNIISNANESYDANIQTINELKIDCKKAYEYAKGRDKNEDSIKQWEIMIDPESNLLFGFLERWKNKKMLNNQFIIEAKQIISEAFDTIIELESGKKK